MELNWSFRRGWDSRRVGGRVKAKTLLWGGMDCFLKQHIVYFVEPSNTETKVLSFCIVVSRGRICMNAGFFRMK